MDHLQEAVWMRPAYPLQVKSVVTWALFDGWKVRRKFGEAATEGLSITVVWLIEVFIKCRIADPFGCIRAVLIFVYVIKTTSMGKSPAISLNQK